ncbi:MAG: hypothetical protein IJN07_02675 [Clostridia bacterium]|nr:hypothetical protein [Clostridia bacterium]
MKQCPRCHMVVDAYNECPICGAEITGEPICEADTEHYCINRWLFPYLIKRHLFPLICTLSVLIIILTGIPALGKWSVLSLFVLVCMWVEALYKNLVFKLFSGIYSEGFLEFTQAYSKYVYGVLGVLLALLGRMIV